MSISPCVCVCSWSARRRPELCVCVCSWSARRRPELCVCVRCFSRNWQVVDYGMCDLMDLLAEIPDTTITVSQQDGDTLISVPKRGEALLFVCCITLATRCISRV